MKFEKPKKDTCKKCDTFKARIITAGEAERQILKEWHDNHLKDADELRKQMNQDLEDAKNDQDLETITYDMQKTLSLPR